MNTKKICIFFMIIIATFCFVMFIHKKTYAESIDDTFIGADDFVEVGKDTEINKQQLQTTSGYIYNALLAIAISFTVIVGIILGIKFMMADAENKASIKESLMPYVISCSVIFGAFTIWKLVVNILK